MTASSTSDIFGSLGPSQIFLVGGLIFLAVAIPTVLCAAYIFNRRRNEDAIAATTRKYNQWRAWVTANDCLPEIPVDIILKAGETAHYSSPAELVETRSVRTTDFAGASTRLGRINVGSGRAHSRSHDEWQTITSGQLVITNSRLIYNGEAQSRIIPLASIVSVKADATAVAISSTSREKTMVFRNVNGPIIRDTIQILTQN